ncbi:MAG TPA: hypothetical protein VJW73_14635, partial [Gemmatimonadaceae bacterium]|nr:hypothetical protein [Gemmatimonadaceae bacterium]
FDALFAMAVDDAHQASVSEIRDGSYNDGQPIRCHCFETGEKWHYVWTRDLAYALDLGLAGFDPERAVNGLLFKTSGFRPGVAVPAEIPDSSEQIIQDTGSGGSWPVSTDRVAWSLGAGRTLANLEGEGRTRFARQAYRALRGTAEADRVAAYDPRTGLYGGEESFLDWREQTYAPWIVHDLPWMAQSKALSTNVDQYRALRLLARLAGEVGARDAASRYVGWADSLRVAIDRTFWVPAAGMYATYTTPNEPPRPIDKYDLLGNDLAIISGVASEARARSILSHYPFAPFGPPVVWPEAPDTYVYHNRAIWPFVTAYTLRAAARVGHVAGADRAIASLMRGAALHLSNMENLEWLTGESQYDDGPAINSRRQLWSIAAYYGMVTGTIFGWEPEIDGVRIAPFLTSRTRALLGPGSSARLGGLVWEGKPIEIVLHLPPPVPAGRVYSVREVQLDGRRLTGPITRNMLSTGTSRIDVRFGAATVARDSVTSVPTVPATSHDDPRVFMPRTPSATVSSGAGGVSVTISTARQAAPVTYRVFRDGQLVVNGLTTERWTDPRPNASAVTTCYSVEAVFVTTHLASQPSAPSCVRGTASETIAATDSRMSGAELVPPGDSVDVATRRVGIGTRLVVSNVRIAADGDYVLTIDYDNHVFALNTGVTNGVKRLAIVDSAGTTQHQVVIQMPHTRAIDGKHPVRESTRAYMHLAPGIYRIELSNFFNMSELESNARYSGPGGKAGAVNEVRVAAIRIDAR